MKLLNNQQTFLEIRTTKGIKFLNSWEILYIEANRKRSILYFLNEEQLETFNSLKWYEEKLISPEFCRCHESFMVNCAYIDFVCGNRFILLNEADVLISRVRKPFAIDCYKLMVQKREKVV